MHTARRPRRALLGLLAVGAALLVVPATPAAAEEVVRPDDGVFLLDGHGFGHGRGLSQYGAYGAARAGLSYAQVLGFYYPGATLGRVADAERRVLLTAEDADLVVTNGAGLVVRDEATGTRTAVGDRADWAQVRVRVVGAQLAVEALQAGTWVPVGDPVAGPVQVSGRELLQVHQGARVRAYRGVLTAARSGSAAKPLYVVDTVPLDDYVRGVVPAEMPSGWHPQALAAQAVAARSYGVRPCPQAAAYPATALYDVVDTTACQVYGGADAEQPSTDAAVALTAGTVLQYGGAVLRAEFSASNGGWTVDAGGPFVAAADPYDAQGTAAARSTGITDWRDVRVPAAVLEAAFGTGRLRSLSVLARDGHGEWGGRVLTVRLVGETRTVDVSGARLQAVAGLKSTWFTVHGSPIETRYAALGGAAGLLGPPLLDESPLPGGRFRPYARGSIYWSAATGAHEVHGSVLARWGARGWEGGDLGYPTTDEMVTPDGVGRYNHFTGGSVYWSPSTGAWAVTGPTRAAWASLGWERGVLGYPSGDEAAVGDGVGRSAPFTGGTVWLSPATGAHEVHGSIATAWAALGGPRSALGYPTGDEAATADGSGRSSAFQGGSLVWSPATGAHEVRGSIAVLWQRLGATRSALGYPLTDEQPALAGPGRRQRYAGGWATWSLATGAHSATGSIGQRWAEQGAEAGPLGMPVDEEHDVPGGRASTFEHGTLTWDRATGVVSLTA